jgi:hypothetical protein
MWGEFFYELNSGCLQDGKGQTSGQKRTLKSTLKGLVVEQPQCHIHLHNSTLATSRQSLLDN